jgi:hypothetical protein
MQQDAEEHQKRDGWMTYGPDKDGNKRMERQSKGSGGLQAYCNGGQGPPRDVAPWKKNTLLPPDDGLLIGPKHVEVW